MRGNDLLPRTRRYPALGQIIRAPIAHRVKYRREGLPEIGQRIFGFRRNDRINSAVYKSIALQLSKLLRQHFVGSFRNKAVQFAVSQRFIHKLPKYDRLVFSAD